MGEWSEEVDKERLCCLLGDNPGKEHMAQGFQRHCHPTLEIQGMIKHWIRKLPSTYDTHAESSTKV